MKREVRREVSLAPFSLGIAELELLWIRLEPLFSEAEHKAFYVEIEFDSEKLTFDSIEELKAANFPKPRSTNFTLHCHGSNQSIHLYTALHAGAQPRLVVTSETEVWSAGAREVILTVINQNRVWHHWLRPKLVGALLFLGMLGLMLTVTILQERKAAVSGAMFLGVVGTLALLAFLFFARGRLLPMATLRLSSTERFWRRYSVELTLALAVLSAALTAYGLLVSKSAA